MRREPLAGTGNKKRGSVEHRFRELCDDGLTHTDIRSILIAEGANPSTVETYLKTYLGDGHEAWLAKSASACVLHLEDLQREHGI